MADPREHSDPKLQYEEYKLLSPFWGWVALVLFTGFILGTMLLFHHGVEDKGLHWDLGVLPDTPGESRYSTSEPYGPAAVKFEPLIAPLPEARPLKPAPTENLGYERGEK